VSADGAPGARVPADLHWYRTALERYGRVLGSSALAETRRIVPTPPIAARRRGATPSILVSSEKLRNVLITTISPSTRTLSRVGATWSCSATAGSRPNRSRRGS